jgi:transposase
LLKADAGQSDEQIAAAVEVSARTVWRVRRRWAEQGLQAALHRHPNRRVRKNAASTALAKRT